MRMKLVDDWPRHQHPEEKMTDASYKTKYAGRVFEVGSPVEPNMFYWRCDTKRVWPVVDVEFLTELGMRDKLGTVYVCEHQAVLSDEIVCEDLLNVRRKYKLEEVL